MKVGYWTLLAGAVVAVTLMAGPAWGQIVDIACVELSPTDVIADGELTATAFDADGEEVDLSAWEVVEFCFGDAGCVDLGQYAGGLEIVDGKGVFTITQAMLDSNVFDCWFWNPDPYAAKWFPLAHPTFGYGAQFDLVADVVAAGGGCAPQEVTAPCALICPPDAAVGEDMTMYLLDEEGEKITRQQHLDAGFTWCFFTVFLGDNWYAGPEFVTDGFIEDVMTPEGGIVLTMTADIKQMMIDESPAGMWVGVESPGYYAIFHWPYQGFDVAAALTAGRVGEACGDASCAAAEGEIDYPPPVTEGAPVAGMLGLGLVAAACALGGAMTLRKE